jgi:tetratricopeptide (TPR) repeat protein
MPNAPVQLKTFALLGRGVIYVQRGEPLKAIEDYTKVIEMTDSSTEQKAIALCSRGSTYRQQGEPERAISDYTSVVQMAECPAKQRAIALGGRGWMHFISGRFEEAIGDERQSISLSPDNWAAHANLAIALLALGKTEESFAAYEAAFALADSKNLDEMATDLREANERHGQLLGSEEAAARIEARRQSLRT